MFWRAAGLVAAGALLTLVLLREGSGYHYGGRSESYWFRQLGLTMVTTNGFVGTADILAFPGQKYGHSPEGERATTNAFAQMGTNALPYLLHKLAGHTSAVGLHVNTWLGKAGIKRQFWRNADLERAQAVTALTYLAGRGEVTPFAARRIRALATDKDPRVAASAGWVVLLIRGVPDK